jgi:hypothetical protein
MNKKIFFLCITLFSGVLMADVSPSVRQEQIVRAFNDFTGTNVEVLNAFYHPEVHFVDPIGEMKGLNTLTHYYSEMYKNVLSIRFDFKESVHAKDSSFVTWNMIYSVKALNGGKPITVEGGSHLTFDEESGLVLYHRDYFDMGAMVYEHIPLIGAIIRRIRARLSHN